MSPVSSVEKKASSHVESDGKVCDWWLVEWKEAQRDFYVGWRGPTYSKKKLSRSTAKLLWDQKPWSWDDTWLKWLTLGIQTESQVKSEGSEGGICGEGVGGNSPKWDEVGVRHTQERGTGEGQEEGHFRFNIREVRFQLPPRMEMKAELVQELWGQEAICVVDSLMMPAGNRLWSAGGSQGHVQAVGKWPRDDRERCWVRVKKNGKASEEHASPCVKWGEEEQRPPLEDSERVRWTGDKERMRKCLMKRSAGLVNSGSRWSQFRETSGCPSQGSDSRTQQWTPWLSQLQWPVATPYFHDPSI